MNNFQNPYYSNSNRFGSPWGLNFPNAPIADIYQNVTDPRSAFTRYTSGWGGNAQNPYGRFVQSQYTPMREAYSAAVVTNPNLKWTDFLGGVNPGQIRQQFQSLGPSGRGEQWGSTAPRARWQRWG